MTDEERIKAFEDCYKLLDRAMELLQDLHTECIKQPQTWKYDNEGVPLWKKAA